MKNNVLVNQLTLAYSPLCNRDFTVLRQDVDIQAALESSSLYVIAQRPVIRFDNLRKNLNNGLLEFEIRQESNSNVLRCKLPLFQEAIATRPEYGIDLYVGSNDTRNPLPRDFPLNNIHGIKVLEVNPEDEAQKRFLYWFTPEKFLQNFWNNLIVAEVEGDISAFTRYKVHYVGKATRQEIWQRLTGHDHLQDILSLENPFTYGNLPTHEIVILGFGFRENLNMVTLDDSVSNDQFRKFLDGEFLPTHEEIFLDAEKALVHAMQPKYNRELFKSYPISADGLYKHNYTTISYTLVDPITLVYQEGEIRGRNSAWGGDSLIIAGDQVRLSKFGDQ